MKKFLSFDNLNFEKKVVNQTAQVPVSVAINNTSQSPNIQQQQPPQQNMMVVDANNQAGII